MAEVFAAGVQYNDWKGTSAADDSDDLGVQSFFRNRGVPDHAYVVAVRAYYLSVDPGNLTVRAVYADGEGFDSVNAQIESDDALQFKELDIELTFAEFFSMFKRLSIVLPREGLGLDGREYSIQEA
ncbi:hypothetical protein LCM4577_11080 [Mesorhizobium sp. LCM 4577]|uniref:hypothetical protein n=1 Tax=Mesorhizobium sp. LCM 4577 TaxID=1848288 RepID=UPI0008D8FED6|nr:hypothetical protein [Mesorhizobium sp. LCM 4577]OHV63844.1 hypothetical protein LCM4577_11080 [Mesorhizobium sp. LCM 4577]